MNSFTFKKNKVESAFTLIELLVVIGIIGVLAAIIIPLTVAALERARGTKSLSNLRQIGVAVNLYVVANDGDFPYMNTNSDRQGDFWWPLNLENEVLEYDRRQAQPAGEKHAVFRDPLVPSSETHGISDYGGNTWVFRNAWGTQPYGEQNSQPFRRIQVREPGNTVMVATAANFAKKNAQWWIPYDYPRGSDGGAVADPRLPGNFVGAVFVDGHVESIPGDKLLEDLEFRRSRFDPLYER